MRLLAVFLALICLAPTSAADAANPYEIFRLGISVAEFEQAVEENGGEAFDPVQRYAEERGEEPEDTGPYHFLLGGVPAKDEAMGTFLFENGELKLAALEYKFLPHTHSDGWKPASECEAMFARITAEIESVYGPSTDLSDEEEKPNRTIVRMWRSPEVTMDLYMFIDGMSNDHELRNHAVEGPYCGSLRSHFFRGSEEEREAFEREEDAWTKKR